MTLPRLSAVLLALVGVTLAVLAVSRVAAQGEDAPTEHPPLVMPAPPPTPTPSPSPSADSDDDDGDHFTQVPTTPRDIDDHGGDDDHSGSGRRGRDHPEDD